MSTLLTPSCYRCGIALKHWGEFEPGVREELAELLTEQDVDLEEIRKEEFWWCEQCGRRLPVD